MPAIVSLEELGAATFADTHEDRYQRSLARVLDVEPPPDGIAGPLTAWLIAVGVPFGQVMPRAGIRIAGTDGEHRRVPDLTVWSRPQPPDAWPATADLLLVIEIGSDGAEATAYATAGIVHYWTVAEGAEPAVTLHRLGPDGGYAVAAQMPVEWLLHMPLAWVL